MARHGDDAGDFVMARVTFDLLRPVPIATLSLSVSVPRNGRSVQEIHAQLVCDGRVVVQARGLRIRRRELSSPARPDVGDWPRPDSLSPFVFPFFQHDVGYHTAVDLRVAHGEWGRTPVGIWGRPRVPLVAGRETTPLERMLILADAQSGMGVPLDPMRYTFVNPDLTVYLDRSPQGEWFGFDILSTASEEGIGLAQSAIRDERGLFARSAQSLVVAAR